MLESLRISDYDDRIVTKVYNFKSREKIMSADNQQERLDTKWIVGFTDGEGCFHISINKIPEMSLGWQVLPEFRIVQHEKNELALQKIKNYFGFGKVTINRKDFHGTRKEFRVRGIENLNKLIKFFDENNPNNLRFSSLNLVLQFGHSTSVKFAYCKYGAEKTREKTPYFLIIFLIVYSLFFLGSNLNSHTGHFVSIILI